MKRLDEGFDPARLVGSELEAVLYGSNLAALEFGSGTRITALAGVGQRGPNEGARLQDGPPWGSTQLPTLIGRRVVFASRDRTGGLLLRFDDDSILEFASDESGYESFVVAIGGEEWFV